MNKSGSRIIQAGNPPSDREIVEWIGEEAYEYWKRVTHLIELNYPSIFTPEWLFGAAYRIFCNLIIRRTIGPVSYIVVGKGRTQGHDTYRYPGRLSCRSR